MHRAYIYNLHALAACSCCSCGGVHLPLDIVLLLNVSLLMALGSCICPTRHQTTCRYHGCKQAQLHALRQTTGQDSAEDMTREWVTRRCFAAPVCMHALVCVCVCLSHPAQAVLWHSSYPCSITCDICTYVRHAGRSTRRPLLANLHSPPLPQSSSALSFLLIEALCSTKQQHVSIDVGHESF